MSETPTDPTGQAGDQPSQEEVRAYLDQLRSAPVDQVLAEILSSLLNAAQVKIGRRDGRLLLDASAALVGEVREALPEALRSQLDDVLSQLRMAQVQAEQQVAAAARQGQPEKNDLGAQPAPQAPPGGEDEGDEADGTPPSSPPPASPAGGDASSRLWVPGR